MNDRFVTSPETPAGVGAHEPIAIVGIGCRLPGGADSPARLWELLLEGFDAITPIPGERFDAEAIYSARPATAGHILSRWGGFVRDIDQMDAPFFGLSPREAERLDPQQRMLLEAAWEALEDAGLPPSRLAGARTGVYIGISANDFETRVFADPDNQDIYITTGTARYSASGRLSFFLNLMGPSVSIDSACSSSLVAIHLACQSLHSGENTVTLAGGVNAILQPHLTISFSQAGTMAPDGHCKFGDARADGFVRSEGAGVVVLKRLSTALADGDTIYAIIRGSAVNNDGHSGSHFVQPSHEGQVDMLRRAYADAGVDPGTVNYVEAHGTGTRTGDPIELGAIGVVVGHNRPADKPCLVGSIKTNLGHTEGAAGITGLIKAALVLKHRYVPASLHLENPNPAVAWDDLHLRVCAQGQPLRSGDGPARVGVSSFGITGTNAHLVLEEAPPRAAAPSTQATGAAGAAQAPSASAHGLVLSARSPAALAAQAARYSALLAQPEAHFADICWSAATRREHLDQRLFVAARTPAQAIDALEAYGAGSAHSGLAAGAVAAAQPRVVFVCPGQGGQWHGMARDLLAQEPIFRDAILACDAAIRAEAGWSLRERLEGADATYLTRIDEVQPVLFALQVALAALWRAWGVTPVAVVGHSLGEVAAAHIAGALSLEAAVRIICARSRLLRRVAGQGAMAVVGLSAADTQEALAGDTARVSVAVSNSATSTVISGDPEAVDAILARLQARDIFCRRVNVDVASHSPQMEPLALELETLLTSLQPAATTLSFYSTVTAAQAPGSSLDAAYWASNLRQPVRFAETMQALLNDGATAFVELSPHPVLVGDMELSIGASGRPAAAVASLRRDADGPLTLRAALGALYCAGVPIAWQALEAGVATPLPLYPWQRERYWMEMPTGSAQRGHADHWLLGWPIPLAGGARAWENRITAAALPLAYEHRLGGVPRLPAAAAVGVALTAAAHMGGAATALNLYLDQQVVLDENAPTQIQVAAARDATGDVEVRLFSRAAATPDEPWQQAWHATVLLAQQPTAAQGTAPAAAPTDGTALHTLETMRREGDSLSGADFYKQLEQTGIQIGESLRRVVWLWRRSNELVGEVSGPAEEEDPTLLFDPCFELASFTAAARDTDNPSVWMPVRVLGITQLAPPSARMWCHVQLQVNPMDAGKATACLQLYSSEGELVAAIAHMELQQLGAARRSVEQMLHTVAWRPAPLAAYTPSAPKGAAPWLIMADRTGVGEALAAQMDAAGARTLLIAADAELRPALDAALATEQAAGVVYLGGLAAATAGAATADALAQAQSAANLLRLVHRLQAMGKAAPMYIVTAGAVAASERDAHLALDQAPLWGIGRALYEELPEFGGALIDLDPAYAPAHAAQQLARELAAAQTVQSVESQTALRGDQRLVARLVRMEGGVSPQAPAALRTDGAYLLTGGFGGIGTHVARRLVEEGARRLILMGRTSLPPRSAWRTLDPASPEGRRVALVRELEHKGATVHIASLDVGDESALRAWLAAYAAEGWPAIRGVIHMAAVYDGHLLQELDPEALGTLLRPKVVAAWVLSEVLPDLDFCVFFSSIGALLPQAGQGAYAAANAFLDALAHSRAAQGQAAISVNWGVWSDSGEDVTAAYRKRTDMADRLLAAKGITAFHMEEGLDALDLLLPSSVRQATFTSISAAALLSSQRARPTPFLAELAHTYAAEQDAAPSTPVGILSLPAQLAEADPAARAELLEAHVQQVAARVLKMKAKKLDPNKPFGSIGFDSLMGVELRNRLEIDLGLRLPSTLAWNYPTVSALSSYLLGRLFAPDEPADGAAQTQAAASDQPGADLESLLANVKDLTDEEVLAALLKGTA